MTSAARAGRPVSRLLVGRDDVLEHLESVFEDSLSAGHLTTALVEGPAGIGKTRVVHELADRLRERADVLVGHCVAGGGQILPYAPLVDLLAGLVRREGAESVRRWAGPAAGELGRLVPALRVPDEGSAPIASRGSRLFQALATLVERLSARRPLVLVIEDVHWVDDSTRELLALLASQQPGPVLLLLTLRSDETPVPAGLARYVAELVRPGGRRVRLPPLTRDEQARQVSDILGLPPRRDLLDEVYARAEGNPFFAEELLTLAEHGQDGLPVTVRDLLLARLESLDPATRQVLRTASTAGREVPHRLLEAVVDVRGARLETALRQAVEAHVLEARGDTLLFRHALLQEAVAASLLPGEAARTHRRLAETLQDRPELAGPGARVAGRVAGHWDAAGEPERALVASLAAAREAKEALAFAESLAHHERAIALLGAVEGAAGLLDEPLPHLLWEAAEVANLAAHPQRAIELVRRAIALVDREDPHLHGYLHARLGRCLWMGADGRGALAAYERAVELVPPEPPTRWRAAALSGLSQILMLADRNQEAERLARKAIEVAGRIPDGRSVEGHARCNLGVALGQLGRVEEGIAELRTARRIAEEELDDVDDVARALVNLQSVLYGAGRVREATAVALECVTVGDALGLRRRKGVWSRCDAAQCLLSLGRPGEAQRLLDEARELAPQGIDAFRADLVQGQLRLRQGELDEARRLLERAREEGTRLLDPQLIGPLHAALVETATWQGDLDAAAAWLHEGLARLPDRPVALFVVPLLAAGVVAGAHGACLDTGALLGRADASLAGAEAPAPHAAAALATARAALSGDPAAWSAAADAWERLGDAYEEAHARIREAESLVAAGDREAAADRLRAGLEGATASGAAQLQRVGEELGRRARLRVAPPPTDNPYRLTVREREVLTLLAQGLTDRAIGARLFISHRTVERHVSHLLAKLDADRRSELVATALRERLLDDSSAV